MTMLSSAITAKEPFFDQDYITYNEEAKLVKFIKKNLKVTITKLEKILDPNLFALFKIKQAELGATAEILQLIHSTAASNVESIKKHNLDWRKVSRAKYGFGVSFSKNADYANYHSSFNGGAERAFIICDVCVKNIKSVSDNKDTFPDSGAILYDTYRSINEYVYVKFEDFTYYPKYVLYYTQPNRSTSQFCRRRYR